MITCTRKIEFDAAHRVLGHGGACRHLHGHRYVAEVTCGAPSLDDLGMVVDFGEIKRRVGVWVNEYLDHNVVLNHRDPLAKLFLHMTPQEVADPDGMFAGKVPFLMDGNPTAENLAKLICGIAVGLLPPALKVLRVRVWETPACYADYINDGRTNGG